MVTISLALVVALLLCRGQSFVWYAVSYQYISTQLCVNPDSECNGLCQLAEKVSRDVPGDDARLPIVQLKEVHWANSPVKVIPEIIPFEDFTAQFSFYNNLFVKDPPQTRLFRPPRC